VPNNRSPSSRSSKRRTIVSIEVETRGGAEERSELLVVVQGSREEGRQLQKEMREYWGE
jgi:hypothetical protein